MGSGISKRKCNIICCGLDNGGKTTIINHLKPVKEQSLQIVPTVGFQVDRFKKGGIEFTCFDMSGQGRYRNLWEHYYRDAVGVFFVIDASDKIRICIVKEELDNLLGHPDVANIPLVIFANKNDVQGAFTADEIRESLQLDLIKDRPWTIVSSNALRGEGIERGLQWLIAEIMKKKR